MRRTTRGGRPFKRLRPLPGILALILAAGGAVTVSAAVPSRESEMDALLRRITQLEEALSDQQKLIQELQSRLGLAEPERPPVKDEPPPTTELTLVSSASGRNFLNLALDGLVSAGTSTESDLSGLQLGSHDPSRRGFTVQNVEAVLSGAVDPYFTAQANIVFVESPVGETEIEIEEIFATTTSLPRNLQVKAGHFFTEFGRLNSQHPHSWDFVDQPLSHGRMFGSDNLRSSGARVSWLMPAPFYSELFFAVQNAFGETLNGFGFVEGETLFGRTLVDRSVDELSDLLYVPRYSASVDLTGNQTLLVGASAALGPNGTGDDGRTSLYGVDLFWKWKSPRAHQGFPFVKLQAEGMKRRYRADDPLGVEIFEDWGVYGQVVWGFRRGWALGARYDRIGGDEDGPPDPALEDRWRAAANVTWYPTEYSKLRLQYNHDARSFFEDADSLWLQFEFILGAHASHKF